MEQVVISQRKIEYEQENHDAAEEDAQTGISHSDLHAGNIMVDLEQTGHHRTVGWMNEKGK
jgi:aminoglycoside phosphotransferase (APT) family kinase protein